MNVREPDFALPEQADGLTGPFQLLTIVRPATPYPARQGTGESILRSEQEQAATGPEDARDFGQSGGGIRQMFQDITAGYTVELVLGERQPREIGDEEFWRDLFLFDLRQAGSSPSQHFTRQVAAMHVCPRIAILDQVLCELTGPTANVQDPTGSAQIKDALSQDSLAEREVQRQKAGGGQHGSPRSVIDAADLVSVGIKTDSLDQVVFDELPYRSLALGEGRRGRGWASPWAI
jgi:hypothetical protein